MRTLRALCGAALAVLLLSALPSFAATKIWDGGGADDNFTTPGNWVDDTAPAFNVSTGSRGDDLHFGGTTRLTPFNNTNAGQVAYGIVFLPGAGAFTIGGSNMALGTTAPNGNGISNLSANVQTFNCLVAPRFGRFVAQSNDLVFNGEFYLGNGGSGRANIFDGAFNIYLNNRVSNTGVPSKSGSGTLFINGTNDFTSTFTINAGAVRISANNALGALSAGTTIVGDNGGTGRLELVNNITVGEPITVAARQNASFHFPSIVNVSGTNTLTNNMTLTTGGSEYNFQSDAGQLVLLGNLTTPTTGSRQIKLMGSGDGRIAGNLIGPNAAGSAGSLIKVGGGTWILEGANNQLNGVLTNAEGSLVLGPNATFPTLLRYQLNGSSIFDVSQVNGGFKVLAGQTLAGTGSLVGDVTLNADAIVNPGAILSQGTLTLSNTATFDAGARMTFDLGGTATPGGTANDLLIVNGDLVLNGTINVALNFLAGLPAPGAYTLVRYTGTLVGSAASFNAAGSNPRFSYQFDTTSTPGEIKVTVMGSPSNLIWDGADGATWQAGVGGWLGDFGYDSFYSGDSVTFDDWSMYPTVNLVGTVIPGSVAVDSSLNYLFTGSGSIAGPAGLTKSGPGTLTLSNANSYTGATVINAGLVRAGTATALGTPDSGTTIASGATLDVNGQAIGAEPVTVAGTGTDGAGAIISTHAADQFNALRFVTLSDDAAVGGVGRWDIRGVGGAGAFSGILDLDGHTLTKLSGNKVSLVDAAVTNNGNLRVEQGTFAATRSLIDGNGSILVDGGIFEFENYTTGYVAKAIVANGGGIRNIGSSFALDSTINLLSATPIEVANNTLSLKGAVTGPGTLVKSGGGTLTLLNTGNAWTGGTINEAGTLVVPQSGVLPGFIENFGTLQFAPTSSIPLVYDGQVAGGGVISAASSSPHGLVSFAVNDAMVGQIHVGLGSLELPSGSSVTVGTLAVGVNATNSTNFIRPGATLVLGGQPTDELRVGYKTAETINVEGYLDLSSLDSFTATLGNVLVGVSPTSVNSGSFGGTLELASNTTINAATSVTVGDSGNAGNTVTPRLVFSSGTNLINTPAVLVSGRKSSGTATIRPGGVLALSNGLERANLSVGSNGVNTGTMPVGLVDLSDGSFLASLDHLLIASKTLGGNGTVTGSVVIGSSQATSVDVNNVTVGLMSGGAAPSVANGTFTVSNGTFNVQTNVTIASMTGVNGTVLGALNLHGGAFSVAGDILGSSSNNSTSTLLLDGATLDLQPAGDIAPGVIGNTDNLIKNVVLRSGTLKNVAEINSGAAITKSGPGVLTFGDNAFTGPIAVNDGTLNLAGSLGANAISVEPDGVLAGSGTALGSVIVSGTVSPGAGVGTLATGPQTWNGGGKLLAQINDAGSANGRDLLNVAGTVDVQATPENPFTVLLASPNGPAANFDKDAAVSWPLVTAGAISGFDPAKFAVDTTGFSNDLAGGSLALTPSLALSFTPNRAPALLAATGTRSSGQPHTRSIADYLAQAASDPDGDAVELVNVFGATNGTVTIDGDNIVYTSTASATDVFYAVVRDVRSSYRAGDTVRTATNSYTVTVAATTTPDITGSRLLPDGNIRFSFAAAPNKTYQVQATSYLTNPIPWVTLLITNSTANGQISFDDLQATNYPQRFYRTVAP